MKKGLTPSKTAKAGRKPTGNRGSPEKFYLDSEAKAALGRLVALWGPLKSSHVACALIRLAGGGEARPAESAFIDSLKSKLTEKHVAEIDACHSVFLRLISENKCPDWLEVETGIGRVNGVNRPYVLSFKNK